MTSTENLYNAQEINILDHLRVFKTRGRRRDSRIVFEPFMCERNSIKERKKRLDLIPDLLGITTQSHKNQEYELLQTPKSYYELKTHKTYNK